MPWLKRKRDDHPVDPNERSPQLGVKYKDLLVLDQLMKQGATLSEPRHVLHYLYFSSRSSAEQAAEDAGREGFDVEVREPLAQYPGQWSLVCERHGEVVDPATVRERGDFFDSLAARHGGEYDGWEASV